MAPGAVELEIDRDARDATTACQELVGAIQQSAAPIERVVGARYVGLAPRAPRVATRPRSRRQTRRRLERPLRRDADAERQAATGVAVEVERALHAERVGDPVDHRSIEAVRAQRVE